MFDGKLCEWNVVRLRECKQWFKNNELELLKLEKSKPRSDVRKLIFGSMPTQTHSTRSCKIGYDGLSDQQFLLKLSIQVDSQI